MHTPQCAHLSARFIFSLCLIAGAQRALAGPVYRVAGGNILERFDRTSSNFLSDGSNIDGFVTDPVSGGVISSGGFNSFAAAGPGGLHVDADSHITNISVTGAGGTNNADSEADMTLDDVVISGPAGTLTTSYTVHLSGALDAFNDSQATSRASATVVLNLFGNGNLLNNSLATKNSGEPQIGVDLLKNFTGNDNLTSAPFTVTANLPFTVRIQLEVGAQSTQGSGDTGSISAHAHFSDTLTFRTDGPVFNLPAGYTANSLSANIINNLFIPAPEPTTITLALPTLLPLALRRRAHR